MAVVKADCYSNGEYVAKCIEKDVFAFAVANVDEAIRLRKLGITKPILSLSFAKNQAEKCLKFDIQVAISNINSYVKGLKYHIAVDTGMNRSGAKYFDEFYELLKCIKSEELVGIYSHIYSQNIVNIKNQIEIFDKFCTQAKLKKPDVLTHIYSSNSHHLNDFYRTDMIRIGIKMYENAVGIATKITGVKQLEKGEIVGYDAEFVADKKMTIALCEGGYFDGIIRRFSGQKVAINTDFCEVLGKISMDSFCVDISNCNAKIGDSVVLYDTEKLTFNERSQQMKISTYELMTALKGRFEYVYFN